jgi:hypothetical protein
MKGGRDGSGNPERKRKKIGDKKTGTQKFLSGFMGFLMMGGWLVIVIVILAIIILIEKLTK